MICQLHGGKGINVSTSVWKFWAPLLLSSLFSGFCFSFLVAAASFRMCLLAWAIIQFANVLTLGGYILALGF